MALEQQHSALIDTLIERGITDEAVLQAMRSVPRAAFVPLEFQLSAYRDSALPLSHEQTISQPYVVALMAQLLELRPTDKVLEVGAGSGYAAAVLGALAEEVFTVERIPDLAITAAENLKKIGAANVHVRFGDGTRGWPESAPYDAISVAAAGDDVPLALRRQLAIGGRLVMPIGPTPESQQLVRVRKIAENDFEEQRLGGVRFVPLISDEHG